MSPHILLEWAEGLWQNKNNYRWLVAYITVRCATCMQTPHSLKLSGKRICDKRIAKDLSAKLFGK